MCHAAGCLGECWVVDVAQLAEHRVVVPRVVGSNPIIHPNFSPRAGRPLAAAPGQPTLGIVTGPEARAPAMKRRAKIVCTLGPASSSPAQVRALVDAGMDVARLNFSHGTREEHAAVYREVRAASDTLQRSVAVLVDLQGPKIRLGEFEDGGVTL